MRFSPVRLGGTGPPGPGGGLMPKPKAPPKCFAPSPALLSKLGSIAVHADEGSDPLSGHSLDVYAIRGLLKDPEVQEWLGGMRALALLPLKRSER